MKNLQTTTEEATTTLDAKDLAIIIRRELATAGFAGVKFSVTISRYAGGSTVYIRWNDGPSCDAIDALLARYAVVGFDGMHDAKTNAGPVRLDDGRLVDIYAYIITLRRDSAAHIKPAIAPAVVAPAPASPAGRWIVRCRVSGGITGYREGTLKASDGQIKYFAHEAEAEAECARLTARLPMKLDAMGGAIFQYWPAVDLSPEGGL